MSEIAMLRQQWHNFRFADQLGGCLALHFDCALKRCGYTKNYFPFSDDSGTSVFFSVNSTDACVLSQLMRIVQLPPV
jgi:hypothetical protein